MTIAQILLLKDGWDGRGALAATPQSVSMARQLRKLIFLSGFLEVECMPRDCGGIQINFHREGSDLFRVVDIEPDGTFTTKLEKGIGGNFDIIFEEL